MYNKCDSSINKLRPKYKTIRSFLRYIYIKKRPSFTRYRLGLFCIEMKHWNPKLDFGEISPFAIYLLCWEEEALTKMMPRCSISPSSDVQLFHTFNGIQQLSQTHHFKVLPIQKFVKIVYFLCSFCFPFLRFQWNHW